MNNNLFLRQEDVGRGTLNVEPDGLLGRLNPRRGVPLPPSRLHYLVFRFTWDRSEVGVKQISKIKSGSDSTFSVFIIFILLYVVCL